MILIVMDLSPGAPFPTKKPGAPAWMLTPGRELRFNVVI